MSETWGYQPPDTYEEAMARAVNYYQVALVMAQRQERARLVSRLKDVQNAYDIGLSLMTLIDDLEKNDGR